MMRQCPPECIEALVETGWTVCAEYPEIEPFEDESPLAKLLCGIKQAMKAKAIYHSCYVSAEGHGFPLHWDQHHVIVLQILGSKRWHYSPHPALLDPICAAVATPAGDVLTANTPHPKRVRAPDGSPMLAPAAEELEQVLLERGDVFYLPAGSWHAPKAVSFSLALSVTPVL